MSIKAAEELFFEDFQVGNEYQHTLGRTVIDPDEVWFAGVTTAQNPMHFNRDYASRTRFGKQTVNAPFTNATVTGMSESDLGQNAEIIGWDFIKVPNPLFIGETVYAKSEVVDVQECEDDPTKGVVTLKSTGITAEGKVVIISQRKILVWKSGCAPAVDYFPEF